jgi:hypothetical protein
MRMCRHPDRERLGGGVLRPSELVGLEEAADHVTMPKPANARGR